MSGPVETYFVQVGRASVNIDFKAQAISITLDAAPVVRTEELGDGVLIDRDKRDGRIVHVEVLG